MLFIFLNIFNNTFLTFPLFCCFVFVSYVPHSFVYTNICFQVLLWVAVRMKFGVPSMKCWGFLTLGYLLQETCGSEQKEKHSRRESRSLQTSYRKKKGPQDPQTKIEKAKRKRGKCYIRFNPVPDLAEIRFTTNFHLCV